MRLMNDQVTHIFISSTIFSTVASLNQYVNPIYHIGRGMMDKSSVIYTLVIL